MNAITLNIQDGTRDDPRDALYVVPAGTKFRITGKPWLADADLEKIDPLWKEGTPMWTGETEEGVILSYLVEGVDFERV
jgi:hypothetical protein